MLMILLQKARIILENEVIIFLTGLTTYALLSLYSW